MQLTVIGLATLVGIYLTQLIVEDLLTRQALELEAEYFWDLYSDNAAQPLPNTANMTGYLRGRADLPVELIQIEPGYGRTSVSGRSLLVHVSDFEDERLYLLFEGAQVSDLAFFFGIVPLSIVLLLMYVLLFFAYRWSQRALSPIVRMARMLETVDFSQSGHVNLDLSSMLKDADSEVAGMIEAVESFIARLDRAIERERVFTRDAGHELRTPVAVFKGTLDLLDQNKERPEFEKKALARMRRTVEDMEALLETLLLLAREEEIAAPDTPTLVNSVIARLIEQLRPLAERGNNQIVLEEQAELRLNVRENVLDIVLGNLIRNALTYTTDGVVQISVSAQSVRVEDSGIGMDQEDLANAFEPFFRAEHSREETKGHGLGLSIVRRLGHQFGWKITAHSRPQQGTAIEVSFT